MKKILVINPNTSKSMTDHIRQELEHIKGGDTELTVTCPEKGPETIESAYDEALAGPPTLELVRLRGVFAEQRRPFAEIYLRPGDHRHCDTAKRHPRQLQPCGTLAKDKDRHHRNRDEKTDLP